MKTVFKVILGVSAIGGLIYLFRGSQNIDFKVTGYGAPKVNLPFLTVPVQVQFSNPFPATVPIDYFRADVSYLKKGEYVHAGTIEKSGIALTPGINALSVDTVLSLQNLSKDIFQTAIAVIADNAVTIKTVATITIQGVTIQRTFTNKIYLNGSVGRLGLLPGADRKVTAMPNSLRNLVPPPTDANITIVENGADPIRDTVPLIRQKIKRTLYQTEKLAQKLKGATVDETLKNNFDFLYKYIAYKPDSPDAEEVKSPRRTIYDGGGDCDDYTTLLGSLLMNQGIDPTLRVAAYDRKEWSHIYPVVKRSGRTTTLDPVANAFNYEVPYSNIKDFKV